MNDKQRTDIIMSRFNRELKLYDLRFCKKCRKFKHVINDYHKNTYHCKVCSVDIGKKYCDNDEYRAKSRVRGKKNYQNPEYRNSANNRRLKRLYNITIEQYNKMFEDQYESCAICKIHQNHLKVKLSVDHCHTTGKVRGLLCYFCNTSLGKVKDSIPVLEQMIQYVKLNKGDNNE